MSLEQKIEQLIQAIDKLTGVMSISQATQSIRDTQPVSIPQEPVVQPYLMAAAPAMPAPPTFAEPVAPPKPARPFDDVNGLVSYVTAAWHQLGKEKGSLIHGVLTKIGCADLTSVPFDKYDELFAGIEALKG